MIDNETQMSYNLCRKEIRIMAKSTKNKQLSVRIDPLLESKIQEYTELVDISAGHLVRRAIKEYIEAHPKGTDRAGYISIKKALMPQEEVL